VAPTATEIPGANGHVEGEILLGVDVGGTFTDAIAIDPTTGEIKRAKVSTTPEDQSIGTLETMPALGLSGSELARFSHGMTVGINAVLQRKGAKVGLICTEGTRDMLDTGRIRRDNSDGLYDVTWKRPHQERPLVHRRYVREIGARMLYDGSIHVELNEDQVRRELEFLKAEGVEAVAVCLLNSHVNLEHEERVVELIGEVMPEAYSQSSVLRPVVGEYTRTLAVVQDAYTGPLIVDYLVSLQTGLRERGYGGPAVVMQMNGGVRTIESTVERYPAYTLESGPVAGLLGAEHYGAKFVGATNLVCMDIGGTSTDIGLVVDGKAQMVDEWEVEFALPLGAPAIDVRSIGAGGGSLIRVDEMGTVRVGPESAGARPGPACYDRGGTEPASTDAHVVLGTLRPESFLSGRMPLDAGKAEKAIEEVAERIGMPPLELAAGALRLMNAQIEEEITRMAFDQAVDLRDFVLFAYGGAGAMHAADVARQAGIPEVVVPNMAGGFSALGLGTAPVKVEEERSYVAELSTLNPADIGALSDQLLARVKDDLEGQGVPSESITIERSLHGMYEGQSFDNKLALDEGPVNDESLANWRSRFDAMYDRLYGYSAPEIDITITAVGVSGTGPRPLFTLPELESGGAEPSEESVMAKETVHIEGKAWEEVPCFSRSLLRPDNTIEGPALIDDEMTTIIVPPETTACIDNFGNVRITFR
jgi:N-methylhydantoinase A